MKSAKATLEKLQKNRPDLDIRDVEAEQFCAMIFKDRDYPDGDDVLSMILPWDAAVHLTYSGRRRFCVMTEEGEFYLVDPVSETPGSLFAEHAEKITL